MDLFPSAVIRWRPEYSVNVQALDAQHRNLLEQIIALQEAMYEGRAREAIAEILASLIRYTDLHFEFETALLRTHGYPGLAEQEAQHEELKRQIVEFQQRFMSGELAAGAPVMRFLKHWLTDHICGTDRKYAAFLNGSQVF